MIKKRIGVFISGRGSNLKALIDAFKLPAFSQVGEIVLVHSNIPDAPGLDFATAEGIETLILDHTDFSNRPQYESALIEALEKYQLDLICLAGYMRILSPVFLHRYSGGLLNIHPSLLPRHPGLGTHEAVLRNGDREHGTTVHFVTTDLDGGPRIAQSRVSVIPGDSPEDLAERVLEREHQLYPKVVKWFCEDRLSIVEGTAFLDGNAIHFRDEDIEKEL